MTPNSQSASPYLRTSRNFPSSDINQLVVEINKAYVDTATAVNERIISTFPTNKSIVTGENWYVFRNQRQQSLRQVYTFTSDGNIPHGLNLLYINAFTKIYGTFTDGSIWYPLPYVDVVDATNQINVIVDSTNIVITSGAGAPPTIVSGFVVLEWLSQT